jgi:hypothetical protein
MSLENERFRGLQVRWDSQCPDAPDPITIGDTLWSGTVEMWSDDHAWLPVDMQCHYCQGELTSISVVDMYTGKAHDLPRNLWPCIFDPHFLEEVDTLALKEYEDERYDVD